MERTDCTDIQHEGTPREGDRPCTRCGGTGFVPVYVEADEQLVQVDAAVLDRTMRPWQVASERAVAARVRAVLGPEQAARVETVDADAGVFLVPVPVETAMDLESDGVVDWTWADVEFETGGTANGNPVEFHAEMA